MIACLPMYDRPETAAANDRLWRAVRAALGHGPANLTRDRDLWDIWQSPDLLLAQTCGYPYRARLHHRVQLVGTPVLDLPDCPDGHYCSVFVARRDDPRRDVAQFAAARLACNDALSQSGWAAAHAHAAARGFGFGDVRMFGAHRCAARAVAEGRADLAAIDALSWSMLCRYDGFAAGLRGIARTAPTPALPYVTAPGRDAAALFDALAAGIAALGPDDRQTLGVRGLVAIDAAAYLAVPTPPPPPPEIT